MSDKYTQLVEHYPEWVSLDEREGYEGVIVKVEHLLDFAARLRDEHGFDFLSSITGVDYLPEERMEVVYHIFRSTGGEALVFKVQVPRDNPVLPSLVSLFEGADFQEREAWDLLGIEFTGHPNLERILTWEGFAGHPLRKDWKETYYEQDAKPYDSRWPEGKPEWDEKRTPYQKNVHYPEGFDPHKWVPDDSQSIVYEGVKNIPDPESDLDTDVITINLGPQHPSTHGVFRMVASLQGETVMALKPVMGYLHRNHEKIAERNTYLMNIPFTDRLDYLAFMSSSFAYVLGVESLLGERFQPPERAQYIRVIMAEMSRIASHFFAIGSLLNDLGAYFTPMMYALKERELIVDIFEEVTGARMMCNYFRFGGVARDFPEGVEKKIHELAFERLPRQVDEIDRYLTTNELVLSRAQGIGVLTPEEAINYSASGPVLRASGVPYDIRRANPYSIYDRFDFDVAVQYHGDVYDRYLVRLEEIRQSVRIIQQALTDLPDGDVQAGRPTHKHRVPAGEAYGRVEAPKGELGFYLVSNGEGNPWRYHVRAPSFINLTSLGKMCLGNKVADVIAILGSLDIVLGEVDR